MRRTVKLYRLEEVLETTGISRTTLRTYEEYGLVASSVLEGRVPMYAEEAVETLRRIQRIRNDLGVNLPGVQVILEMRKRIEELQTSLEEVMKFVQEDLRAELELRLRRGEKALVTKPTSGPPSSTEK